MARYKVTKVYTDGPEAGSRVEFTTFVEFRRGDSVKFPVRGYAFRIEHVEKIGAPVRCASLAATPAPSVERPARELPEVVRIYGELRKEWETSNGPVLAVRKRSWELLGGSHAKARYRKQFSEGDADAIPGLDDVAQTIECEFGFIRSADQLFELLKQPAPQRPAKADLMEAAKRFAEAAQDAGDDDDATSFDFGHNVTF